MNLAIHQTSTKPSQNGATAGTSATGDGSEPKVSKETLEKMSKDFGFDGVHNLEDQIQTMWRTLTELHQSDPESYRSFIQERVDRMKQQVHEGEIQGQSSSGKNMFVPDKGFVVKTFVREEEAIDATTRGGVTNHSRSAGNKLFINFCQHKAIKCPTDDRGNGLQQTSSTQGIEVPLVVSELRDLGDVNGIHAYAVDIVLNPWCITRCSEDTAFKRDMVQLGIASVEEEVKLVLDSTHWKCIKSKYKGGLGSKGSSVHPFPLPSNGHETSSDMLDGDIMRDPSALLSSLQAEDDEEGSNLHLKTVCDKALHPKSSCGNLIQEISSTINEGACVDEENRHDNQSIVDNLSIEESNTRKKGTTNETKTKAGSKTILMREIRSSRKTKEAKETPITVKKASKPLAKQMKGFLNRSSGKPALYEEPSTGDGRQGATGGAYSRIMSKCKVVHTADSDTVTRAGPKDNTRRKDGGALEKHVKRGFLENQKGLYVEANSARKKSGEFDAEFNEIMERADPNFARTFTDSVKDDTDIQEFNDTISTLTSDGAPPQGYTPSGGGLCSPIEPEKAVTRNAQSNSKIRKRQSNRIPYHLDRNEDGVNILRMEMEDTKVSTVADVEMETIGDSLTVKTSCGCSLRYTHPRISCGISARFKKKKKILLVEFPSQD